MLPRSLRDIHLPSFYVNGSRLNIVSKKGYLGYIISSNDKDDFAVQKECRAVYARGNMLLRKFKICSTEVKKQLFTSYCSFFYCCALWCNFNKTSLQDLQVAYNNIFRLLMNLPYRCRVSPHFIALGMNHFSVIRRKLVHSLYQRILLSKNTLISTLVRCNHFASSRMLLENDKTPDTCNCRKKEECPLPGKCTIQNVIYEAKVTTENDYKRYIGLTAMPFKKRYSSHKSSFNNRDKSNQTELSKHIWKLKDEGTT